MIMFKTLAIIALLLLSGCDSKSQKEEQTLSTDTQNKKSVEIPIVKTLDDNQSEPLFTLKTIDGQQFNISEIENGIKFKELEGKAIFLIFFGYRCPPCIREIPALIELTKEHKDLAIVAIEVQGYNSQELKEFGQKQGINYNLISSDNHMDFISYIQTKSNWHGSIPFLLGLDKKGKVGLVHIGGVGKSMLESAYQDLVNIK